MAVVGVDQLCCGDNLAWLRMLPSDSVDLVYGDPPYGNRGKKRSFVETWKDGDPDAESALSRDLLWWDAYVAMLDRVRPTFRPYLAYMTIRLVELYRVLKLTGTIYLHCDTTASHYLKLIMDGIWGTQNYLNDVVWCYRRWSVRAKRYQRLHDVILVYARCWGHHTFNVFPDPTSSDRPHYRRGWKTKTTGTGGVKYLVVYDRFKAAHKIEEGNYDVLVDREGQTEVPLADWWELGSLGSTARERVGYPTQKPLRISDRIIQVSSNPGQLIIDPWCGTGTALVSADRLGRRWMGCDISAEAIAIAQRRLFRENS